MPNERPSHEEMKTFCKLTKGIEVCTLSDPDSTPTEDEKFIRNLIANYKRKKPNRKSNKPQERGPSSKWQTLATIMIREGKLNNPQIADALFLQGVEISRVSVWKLRKSLKSTV